jgi:outer membrane protein TolC
MSRRHCLRGAKAVAVGCLWMVGSAASAASVPPSPGLLRSLAAFERDLLELDGALSGGGAGAIPADRPAFSLRDPALRAPLPAAAPTAVDDARQTQLRLLSLPEALEVAVANNPELAERRARIAEMRSLKRSVQGRFWPQLGLNLGGAFAQRSDYNLALEGNVGLYSPTSDFLVQSGGWQRVQTNVASAWGDLALDWELISFERGAALAEQDQRLTAALQQYGDALRQLQLQVSEAYYNLQLADQLQRIREAVVRNDSLVRDQVLALKGAGLVPRLDLLRAEAALQQSRFRLEQAEAMRQSRRQALTNPALDQLAAERQALLRQADRRSAQLLPSLQLFAAGGGGAAQLTKPVIDLQGCCGASNIRQVANQNADWVAGLRLQWRFFDAGVSSGEAAASRSAAEAVLQRLARQRNQIRQELETAFYDYRASLSQLAAAEASYRASREAFRDARARYQLGLADYTDVSETITLLTRSMEGIAESTTLANLSYARMLRQLQPVPDQPQPEITLPITLPASLVHQPQP